MRSPIVLLLALFWACSPKTPSDNFHHTLSQKPDPWSHEKFQDSDSAFTFAIISDLNGGERERIFEVAVAQLNLLNPSMVLSIGDLIDGGTEDLGQLQMEWESFQYRAEMLNAPFFPVGGNHDLTNTTMREVWKEKFGPRYYHFVYKNALFLIVDSEDFSEEVMMNVYRARAEAIEVIKANPSEYPQTEYYKMEERKSGAISAEQSAHFERVIAENRHVRWTFVFMHKPTWKRQDEKGFQRIEKALQGRDYTVFAGHEHSYQHQEKNGQDYMILGTTGGGQNAEDPMSFDHVTLVSVDKGEPMIANLRLDGILNKQARIPLNGDTLSFQAYPGEGN